MGKKKKTKPNKQHTSQSASGWKKLALGLMGIALIKIHGGTIINLAPEFHYYNQHYSSTTTPVVDTSARSTTSGIVVEWDSPKENRWVDGEILTHNDLIAWKQGNDPIFLNAIR